jgi:uncharacterized protein YcbX
MSKVIVRELWRYPVKGCQGVPADSIEVTRMGVKGDRDFALWSENALVDQKETPKVASISARLDGERLRLQHAERGEYVHEIRADGPAHETRWVLDQFESIDQGDEVADWLSRAIDKPVRLVRPGPAWKINFPIPQMQLLHEEPKQRFFAASPVSLANRASLDDLNGRLERPVPMDRFRANVVVDGLEPFQEDELVSLGGDEVTLLQVTPAERCAIITTDQKTGERPKSDLMKVLKQYRQKKKEDRFGSGLIFGSYMTVSREGILRVGDELVAEQ